jgi:hypothetical protein
MKGVPVKTTMSPLECAVWAAEFARVRGGDSGHGAIREATDAADQAVIDLRDAFGVEHLSLRLRELRDDPAAQLETFREHLVRKEDREDPVSADHLRQSYVALLRGMQSPTWQKPSDRKLAKLLAEADDDAVTQFEAMRKRLMREEDQ